MRWIYVSPHLDDAILSIGGLIYEQARAGKVVEVWTIACAYTRNEESSPFAQELHRQWGFDSAEETIRSRRGEDLRATGIVGAHAVYLDFPDCIYRRGREGNWLYNSDTFVSPHPEDVALITQMTNSLQSRLQPGDEIVCPLAIGGHVDHVIVRRAVENLGRSLWYYADIPYLLDNQSALDPIKQAMRGGKQKISWKGLVAWQNSAAAYTSQIPMEFENQYKLRVALAKYWWKGVQLWKQP